MVAAVQAQAPDPRPYSATLRIEDLRSIVSVLASDSLEGREAGTRGEALAAAYILAHMQRDGLRPVPRADGDSSYRQPFFLTRTRNASAYIRVGDKVYQDMADVACVSGTTGSETQSHTVVFAGKGRDADLTGVAGRIVVIEAALQDVFSRSAAVARAGAAGLLVVSAADRRQFEQQLQMLRLYAGQRTSTGEQVSNMPVFMVPAEVAAACLGKSLRQYQTLVQQHASGTPRDKGTPARVSLFIDRKLDQTPTANLVGWIAGWEHPEEVVVITAHYDHIGVRRGRIHPGADDNASGVAALLEVAQAFAQARDAGHPPRRSLLFMAVAAEEKGLLGSEYYSEHPLFPLDKTVANLNMDMVGHLDDAHRDNPRFVSVVGSDWLSTDLHQIHERANQQHVGLSLDYTYNSKDHPEQFYYRSDQYNFAKHGIPVIFYTSGDHEDYHQPTDTYDRLHFGRLLGVTQLVFYTAWELAYREQRIAVDKSVD
ncbi:MAG: hypothetical protein OHK0039_28640 [Bacteroidia bacterium]